VKKRALWGRQLNRKWRSENQRAAISTHNKSEQFGISLVGIGLGEDLERLLNKKTRRSKPPLTRVSLAWISPAAAKKYGSSPTFTSFYIFPTGNTTVSLNICAQRRRRMQNQEA
jgi:hypothetical protein